MYILTRKPLMLSAMALSRYMTKKLDRRVYAKTSPENYSPLVRWGNVDSIFSEECLHNSPIAIKLAHRLSFSRLLAENSLGSLIYSKGIPEKFPVVVRKLLSSSEGRGIVVCENLEEFLPYKDYFWSQYIDFSSEFGVHVLGGEFSTCFRKVWDGENEESKYPIRNSKKGYRFKRVNAESNYPKLIQYVNSVLEVFPISFGRFDLGYSKENGYVAIEFNSAPSLINNTNTLQMYGDFFLGLIG